MISVMIVVIFGVFCTQSNTAKLDKMDKWIEKQITKFYSLKNCKVIAWDCIEMAVREDPVEWYNAKIPYLQCMRVDIYFSDSTISSLITYQDADEWGLYLNQQSTKIRYENHPDSIFRSRALTELPIGFIEKVNVITNNSGNIKLILFEMENNIVSFKAGEVYENQDGDLFIQDMDESILVQLNVRKP